MFGTSHGMGKEAVTLDGITRVMRELQQIVAYVMCDNLQAAGVESAEPARKRGVGLLVLCHFGRHFFLLWCDA